MRLFTNFSFETLSNSYLIGPDGGGDAVLVDPASFDLPLLELIEGMGYYVRSVLLTHVDESHLGGLRTLRKIYECRIFAAHVQLFEGEVVQVNHDDVLDICCKPITVIALPGQGSDSLAYYAGGFLFTGRAMSAAEFGQVANPYAKVLLRANIEDRIFVLPDETVILPFFGPPSTVGLEKTTFPSEDPTLPGAPA